MTITSRRTILSIICILYCWCSCGTAVQEARVQDFGIVIHGGSGNIRNLSEQEEQRYRSALQLALKKAYKILESGGTAIDAVQSAVVLLEDDSLFNAGRGSVFSSAGRIEMDACIMNGQNLQTGAVANIQGVKNPIKAARAVLESSDHVLLIGEGAADFSRAQGLTFREHSYFETQARYKKYLKAKERNRVELDHDDKMGTVGAVAVDRFGNLAAATSTGGLNFKKFGRVGDSSIPGAGTYANKLCAVSCTGVGEYFLRTIAAHRTASLLELSDLDLKGAVHRTLNEEIVPLGGRGGIIAIDHKADIACDFSTKAMFRAYKNSKDEYLVGIY